MNKHLILKGASMYEIGLLLKTTSLYQFKLHFEADKIIVPKLDQSKILAHKALGVQILIIIILL